MFQNYLKSSLRNLSKSRLTSFINISGLAMGIAAALLIFFVIQFETSFDTFHKKRANIYRIGTALSSDDGLEYTGDASFPIAAQLRLDFPQLSEVACTGGELNDFSDARQCLITDNHSVLDVSEKLNHS